LAKNIPEYENRNKNDYSNCLKPKDKQDKLYERVFNLNNYYWQKKQIFGKKT